MFDVSVCVLGVVLGVGRGGGVWRGVGGGGGGVGGSVGRVHIYIHAQTSHLNVLYTFC